MDENMNNNQLPNQPEPLETQAPIPAEIPEAVPPEAPVSAPEFANPYAQQNPQIMTNNYPQQGYIPPQPGGYYPQYTPIMPMMQKPNKPATGLVMGIISLVIALLSFCVCIFSIAVEDIVIMLLTMLFPLAGMILGIIGVSIDRKYLSTNGIAITGIIINTVNLMLIGMVAFVFIGDTMLN